MAIAEELQVVIRAEADRAIRDMERFGDSVDNAESGVKTFGERAEKLGGSMTRLVTGPLLGLGAAFTAATIEAGNYADKILDLNQITGLSTDYLQELEGVARVAGVSFDGLTGVIQRFTARLPSIEAGSSEAANAFNQLGVELRDSRGEIRSMEQLFPELITALQGIENVTERNAIAQQIFGRSLGDLAPVLGLTADEMDRARESSQEFLRTEEELKAANEYRIAIAELGAAVKSLWRDLAQDLMPVLKESVIPAMSDAIDVVRDVVTWFGNLDASTQKIILSAGLAAAALGPAIGLAGKAMGAAAAVKGLAVAFGLTNPIVAAFLVTLTAVVAGVGFLISRARTAAQENKLLADAIEGSVTSLEEYDEALAVLDQREDQQQRIIDQTTASLEAQREELERLRQAEEEGRAAGFDETLLAGNLRAQREMEAAISDTERHLQRTIAAREGEREAIEANKDALREQLEEEQRIEEERQTQALLDQAARLDARIQAQIDAAEKEGDARVDAHDDANNKIEEGVTQLYGRIGQIAKSAYDREVSEYERSKQDQYSWQREREEQHARDLEKIKNELYERDYDNRIRWAWAAQDEITAMYEDFNQEITAGVAQPTVTVEVTTGVTTGVDAADWIQVGSDVARAFKKVLESDEGVVMAIREGVYDVAESILNMYVPGLGALGRLFREIWDEYVMFPLIEWAADLLGLDLTFPWEEQDIQDAVDEERAWRDELNALLREEIEIRNQALRELNAAFRLEFTVLRDLWDRNLINTEEFVNQMEEMNEQYEEERSHLEEDVNRIRQILEEGHTAQALEKFFDRWGDDFSGPHKFGGADDQVALPSATKPPRYSGDVHVHIEGDTYGTDALGVKINEALDTAKFRGMIA